MADLPKPQLAVYVAAAIAIALIGFRFLGHDGSASGASGGSGVFRASTAAMSSAPRFGSDATESVQGTTTPAGAVPGTTTPADAGAPVVVDIAGAVRRPGVYSVPAGARVIDAVRKAGGLSHRADPTAVNLAAKLSDGGQVVVPARGSGAPSAGASPSAGAAGSSAGAGGAAVAGGVASGAPSAPVNLNTATADQLVQLDGIGPALAGKIVAYRSQHGSFHSIDELDQVSGIGPKKLEALRSQLTL
jgi:competence protein ComEA